MKSGNSKTKILIISACSMLVVAVVLIIVIINLNKEKEPLSDVNDITSLGQNAVSTDVEKDSSSAVSNQVTGTVDGNESSPASEGQSAEAETPTPNLTETAEVEPIIVTLGEYTGIKVDYSPVIITDSDIDSQLDSLRSEYTEIVDMPDRPFEKGDMAIVTYEGKVDGKLIKELYAVCLQVILGRGMLPDDFENEIIGRKKGDKFTVSMDYPDDFTDIAEVAGKTVVFDVSLVDGFIFYDPEIDDKFISEATGYSTVEEYRSKTKEAMQKEQDDIAYAAAMRELKNKVTENATFSGPIDTEIKKQYVLRINELNTQYQEEYGVDAATFYQIFYGISPENYTASVMADVTVEVKYNYVLKQIAADKNISLEEADQFILDSAVIEGLKK